jgi:hypothetical protein
MGEIMKSMDKYLGIQTIAETDNGKKFVADKDKLLELTKMIRNYVRDVTNIVNQTLAQMMMAEDQNIDWSMEVCIEEVIDHESFEDFVNIMLLVAERDETSSVTSSIPPAQALAPVPTSVITSRGGALEPRGRGKQIRT